MRRGTTEDFAVTAAGLGFLQRYDRVLAKWPAGTVGVDVPTRHGITRVNACGPTDAAPVVLLSGGGATSTSWFVGASQLTDEHRVYAIDFLGDPGRSVVGERLRSVEDLMWWLSDVLGALGLESVAVVGHSYGAMVALAFAARHPGRVDRLVLLDPNPCFAGFRPDYLLRAVPLLLRPTATRQRALIGWETAGSEIDRDWLDLVAYGAEHFPSTRPVVPGRPRPGDLERVVCPTTVLLAGRSRIHDIGKVEAGVRTRLPHAGIETVAGVSHYTLPMAGAESTVALSDALRG
ncbi:alpha/beta fold hydrolase [Prescottella equi]|uniref:alpha/beta fold hydrolase n=1 Tax=Rhodococcus hoagii TaxID=43767 RepID=UPI000A0F9B95|nr:alpha/beta hydrolase [Prescottella equi]ORM10911.1 lipase [Prescottella equi]